jgi:hypothetical protein
VETEEAYRSALLREIGVAEACAIHCRSAANQTAFVLARRKALGGVSAGEGQKALQTLRETLKSEIELCRRLYTIQMGDSRIGFEASNQYMYVPLDLVEKTINCRDLLTRWLPALGQ